MKNKRALVYILHDIAVGGAEVALISAIPQLATHYNLKVIVLGTINYEVTKGLTPKEKELFVAFNYPIYTYPVSIWRVVKYIKQLNPNLIVCSFWRASIIGIILKQILPDLKFYSFNHSTRFPHFFSSLFTKWAGKSADVILTDSIATTQFVKNVIKPVCPVKEVSFLTHTTRLSVNTNAPKDGDVVRFMFLGRINKVKNLPLIIRVIKDLRERRIPVILDVYGRNDGDITESERIINESDLGAFITFKGEVNILERFSLFQNYHFYIQLSAYEGMAMSVAEAMQNGLVCIVSPVGEIINYSTDMESAVYFDIFDNTKWQENIDKVLTVINDNMLYDYISANCHNHFLKMKSYSDSLIEQLES